MLWTHPLASYLAHATPWLQVSSQFDVVGFAQSCLQANKQTPQKSIISLMEETKEWDFLDDIC